MGSATGVNVSFIGSSFPSSDSDKIHGFIVTAGDCPRNSPGKFFPPVVPPAEPCYTVSNTAQPKGRRIDMDHFRTQYEKCYEGDEYYWGLEPAPFLDELLELDEEELLDELLLEESSLSGTPPLVNMMTALKYPRYPGSENCIIPILPSP
jgi:hypothetical protein